MILRTKSIILFLLEVGGLAFYLWNCCVLDKLADNGNAPLLFSLTCLGIVILVGSLLYSIIILYNRFLVPYTQMEKKDLAHHQLIMLTPLLLLYMTLLEHFIYLRDIRGILLLVSLLGSAYLHYCLWEQLIKKHTQNPVDSHKWESIRKRIFRQKKISHLVLILSILFYIMYASGLIFPTQPITGDEPHYLLITKSLISDGDINLTNNYRNKDYLQFYPGELESHARPGKKGPGYEYSKHSPGLPVLLVPSYFIGDKLGRIASDLTQNPSHRQHILIFTLHVSMGLIAALLCWIFFLFARDFTKNQNVSLLSWFIFTTTSPLIFYSHLIYPEIPASLLMLAILYLVLFSTNRTGSTFLWAGLGIALLPWLGVKYIILSSGLLGIVVFNIWRSDRKRGQSFLLFITPILISAGFYILYLWSLYGNILPSSIYKGYLASGPSFSLAIFHLNFGEFIRCGLSYLFDQAVGIFPYSPIYLIFLPGVVLSFVHKKRLALPLLEMLLLYWGFCSLAYYWGGYCPPGRTLLPVVCLMALFMAGALAWGKTPSSVSIHRILLFLSFGITFLCAKDPKLLYHESLSLFVAVGVTLSNFLSSLNNSFLNFQILVPSLLNKYYLTWTSLIFWLLGFILICILFLRKEKKTSSATGNLRKPIIAVFIISMLLTAYTFFDIHIDKANQFNTKSYKLYFQDSNNFGQELSGFWTKDERATEILIKTDLDASNIIVKLSSPAPGKTTIRVGRSRQSVIRNRTEGQEKILRFPSPIGFPTRDGYLYSIRIQEEGGFYPFRLDPRIQDNRFLGVNVEVAVEQDKK